MSRAPCPKCEAARAASTASLGALNDAQARIVDLETALRSLNNMGGDERGGYCICPLNDGSAPDAKHATACANVRRALYMHRSRKGT